MNEPSQKTTELSASSDVTNDPAAAPAVGAALPAASSEERYRLLDEIARGGMGVIYRAFDTALNREVAVKVLQDKYAPDSAVARRFADEALIAGQLQHPAIPPVHDLGILADGRLFLAMKLIKGQTLADLLDARSEVASERGRFVAVFEQVCQAVAYAHAHGVIHRDLKPANVMVGAFGEVQLMDWGLAKVLASRERQRAESTAVETRLDTEVVSLRDSEEKFTQAGSVLGTPAFMPPEQAIGAVDQIDARSDVFGLGAMLAVILTNRPPFVSDNVESARQLAARGKMQGCLARLDACGADPELLALCKHCLAPEKEDRPADGGEVARAVAQLRAAADERARRAELDKVRVEGEKAAVEARALERRKRRQLWLGAAAALVLAMVGGLTAVLAVQRQANGELEAKNRELAAEQAKVQARFELAQKAIATFHTGVSEDVLLKNPQFQELRTRLLREAAGFYGDLEKLLEGQRDANSRRLLAEGYYQLGGLTRAIGSQPEALKVHQKALAVRRELAAADADVSTKLDLARSLGAVGNLLRATGDRAAALAVFQEQRDRAAALEAESPTDAVRAMLAQSYHSIGLVLSSTSKRSEALEFYDKAIALRQKLADANPDVPEFQRDLAASLTNMGQLLGGTPKRTEALAAFEKAAALQQKLADAHPDVPSYQDRLANIFNSTAVLLMGKPAEARTAFEKALRIQQTLADTHPAVIVYQGNLARTLNNLGSLLARTGKPAEALTASEKAHKVRQKLADAHPDVPELRRDLARSHHALGNLLRGMDKRTEALAAFEKSLVLRQELADAHPDVLDFQSELAMSYTSVGALLADMGKLAAALASCQNALTRQEKLAEAHPTVLQFQSEVARNHHNVGMLLEKLDKPAEALASYQKALELRRKLADTNPNVPDYQDDCADDLGKIGRLQRRTGRSAAAAASLRQAAALLERLPAPRLGHSYRLAHIYALLAGIAAEAGSDMTAAQGQAAADKAVAALRRAIAAGYRDIEQIRTNTDLKALHARADFQKLTKELEAKLAGARHADRDKQPPAGKK